VNGLVLPQELNMPAIKPKANTYSHATRMDNNMLLIFDKNWRPKLVFPIHDHI